MNHDDIKPIIKPEKVALRKMDSKDKHTALEARSMGFGQGSRMYPMANKLTDKMMHPKSKILYAEFLFMLNGTVDMHNNNQLKVSNEYLKQIANKSQSTVKSVKKGIKRLKHQNYLKIHNHTIFINPNYAINDSFIDSVGNNRYLTLNMLYNNKHILWWTVTPQIMNNLKTYKENTPATNNKAYSKD